MIKINKATVIIPTTGKDCLIDAIDSIKNQTIETDIYLVCDGQEFHSKILQLVYGDYHGNIHYLKLPYNIGKDGYYGHRSFAGVSHFVNSDYILFLDEDNWLEPNHVESLIDTIEDKGLDWAYSLRNIYDKDKNFICHDDCESLGNQLNVSTDYHIDTSCYCLRKNVAIKVSWMFHGKYGQDRVFYKFLHENFSYYGTSGKYTLNYRLEGNENSVTKEFFLNGNEKMLDFYGEGYYNMWRK